ncbi:MAG: nuclease [Desulfobacteraceae bacterium]|nr:nuclease [Desulfobacteraceae bacterium]MBC2756832.1 nuclease [Desulfobacteraceae bacterium]
MPENLKITIVADDRERQSRVIKYLSEMPDVAVEIARLSTGDYLADNRIVFERKTLNDFAMSIIDGRLFKQAARLANNRYKPVVILEGTGRDLSVNGIRREAMQGALISISLIYGIPVLRAMDSYETASLIRYAAFQIRSITGGGFSNRAGYQPKTKSKRQLFILQGLPGIGPKKAKKLLDMFGSVERIIAASVEEIQIVDGISNRLAEKIKWAVHEETAAYGFHDDFDI